MTLSQVTRCAILCALALGSACKRTDKPEQPAESAPAAAAAPMEAAPPPITQPTIQPIEEMELPPGPQIDRRAVLAELGPPSLVVLRQVNGRCEWSVLRPPQLEERMFLVSGACPSQFTWDMRGRRALFVVGDAAYLHDWQTAKVERLDSPPLEPAVFGFSGNDTVLACTNERVPRGDGYDTLYQLMLERQEDGSWKKVAYQNLGNHGTGELCPDRFNDVGFGEMRYNPGYQVGDTCTQESMEQGATPGRKAPLCPSPATVETVEQRIKGERYGIEYLSFAERSFIASPVEPEMDDSDRFAPMVSIQDEVITEIYNRRPGAQKYLLLSQDHFLVTNAADMTYATLFKKGQAEPLKTFPDEAQVFWIPGTVAATTGVIDLVEKKAPVKGSVAPLQ